ncbi:unnamed protein product [Lactuca virosa]|uniref:Dynamin stalk domain-containing protein n=1 Tax=Lactuca virosa TaxID=75947 RepID=A0AAU9P1S1_9ASTR|nr:unnamed protein product [Lactuca virosa]
MASHQKKLPIYRFLPVLRPSPFSYAPPSSPNVHLHDSLTPHSSDSLQQIPATRTIGVISKIDQAPSDPKVLAAVQALLLGQGPRTSADIPWVALIGQSVSIASAQSGNVGSDNSLETSWRAESESLKSILTGVPQSKLGRLALVETLAHQIRSKMKIRLPSLLSGYVCNRLFCYYLVYGKSQIVQDELVRLGESMVTSSEGIRALALELCHEFEDKFLQHIMTGEGSGWKVVASFEVSASANAIPGLGRYPPFKREVVAIATTAVEGFKNDAKTMVTALVDMERVFVPAQHFIRLVQRSLVDVHSVKQSSRDAMKMVNKFF